MTTHGTERVSKDKCQDCNDGCEAIRFCAGCQTWTCPACWHAVHRLPHKPEHVRVADEAAAELDELLMYEEVED
jgi:hypothetical protein